jgi:hypothetical protein
MSGLADDPWGEHQKEIPDLFACPPPSYGALFDDPGVRSRLGERIGQAMNPPKWSTRPSGRASPRAGPRRTHPRHDFSRPAGLPRLPLPLGPAGER